MIQQNSRGKVRHSRAGSSASTLMSRATHSRLEIMSMVGPVSSLAPNSHRLLHPTALVAELLSPSLIRIVSARNELKPEAMLHVPFAPECRSVPLPAFHSLIK